MEQHMPVSELFVRMFVNLVKHFRCTWPGNRWNAHACKETVTPLRMLKIPRGNSFLQ